MACKKVELLVISPRNPLSNQLEKKTGDPWKAYDFSGSTSLGGIITHKKTGRVFTVMNTSEAQSIRGKRRKDFLTNVKRANKLCK